MWLKKYLNIFYEWFRKRSKLVFVGLVFGFTGLIFLSLSFAAQNWVSLESENALLSGAAKEADTSASGGYSIKFGSNQSPSGQAMPTGDLPSWKQIFTEDFTTNVSEGGFPGTSYNAKWGVYPDGSNDTSANIEGSNSRYYASKVVSVRDGVLNKRLRTETINGVPTPLVATLTPLLPGTPAYNPSANGGWPELRYNPSSMTYGRYSVRFKADPVAGFKTAWLLWPETEKWPEDGEIDFPEGNLNERICAFTHYQDATVADINNGVRHQDSLCSSQNFTQWHTATIERTPTYIRYLLDDQEIGRSTTRLPNKKMNWRIQTETCFTNCQPASSATGNVQIDWATVYAYDPTVTGTPTPPPSPIQANILNEDFEGRGQTANNGTLLNATNSFAQINSSIPVAGFYVNDQNSYTGAPNSNVLPAFDTSRKVSGTKSAKFSLQSVGRNTGGGSFYHYYINNPKPTIHTKLWWQFDSSMGIASGYPALATFRSTYSGQGLTYLRFTSGRNLQWQNAGDWSTVGGSYQYQPDTWYEIDMQVNTTQNQSILTVRNTTGSILQQTTHSIPDVSQIGFFEFGALQGALQNYTTLGSFWFDDVKVGDSPL